MPELDPNDNGYRSRKMVMAYVVIALISGGYMALARWPSLYVAYAEFCMALLAAASIYSGGNAAVKWMAARNRPQAQVEASPEPVKPRKAPKGPPVEPDHG